MKNAITTVRLDAETFRQLKDCAQREDRSISWLIRRAVEQLVSERSEGRRSHER